MTKYFLGEREFLVFPKHCGMKIYKFSSDDFSVKNVEKFREINLVKVRP